MTDIIPITEGEKKSLSANQAGFPTIGLVGVWGWQKRRERDSEGRSFGERQLIPDLAALKWRGRRVVIAFDSDAINNRSIRQAEDELAKILTKAGAIVRIVRIPPASDGKKLGLDDFLVLHGDDGPAALRQLIEQVLPASKNDGVRFKISEVLSPHRDCHTNNRRICLQVDGQDMDAVALRLDSDVARDRLAKKWSAEFGLDPADIKNRLRELGVEAVQSQRALPGPSVRGAESPPTPHTLDAARPVFNRRLAMLDEDQLDVIFGAIMAHRLDGDPVWLFVVGAPGDSKTETLRALSQHPNIFMISTLTPAALISGYETEGEDPSLLPKLDGKVLLIKDFTSVLDMPNEKRSEVLGTLRDAYDGEAGKTFGTGQTRKYKSRFGLVAAVTPAIDDYWTVGQQLGERFLKFRLRGSGRKEKVSRAVENTNDESRMRTELSAAALGVLAQKPPVPDIPVAIVNKLIALADFVALARSAVARDRGGVIQHIPSPEIGTRVAKALKKLAMGIAMARGITTVTEDVYAIVRRVGLDSIPSMRARLIQVMWRFRAQHEKTVTIADEAEIPTATAKTWLDDLRLLGIVGRGGAPQNGYTWVLADGIQDLINRSGLCASYGVPGVGGDSAPPTPTENSMPEMNQVRASATDDPREVVSSANSPPPPVLDDVLDVQIDGLILDDDETVEDGGGE